MRVNRKSKVAAVGGIALLMGAMLGLSAGTANAVNPPPVPWVLKAPQPSPWVTAALTNPEPSPWRA